MFLQHGVCGLFSVEAGGDSRRLSKCGQRPTGRPAAALRWGRALGHECGSRPRATRCQICIDAPPGRRGSLVRNAAARHDERPTEAACEACWAASGKSQAEGALRRAFFAWRLLRESERPRLRSQASGPMGSWRGPCCCHPWGRYRLQPAAEAAREENAAHPEVVLALESLRAHQSCAAALIRSIEERVERHVAPDERGEPAKKTPDTIGTHLVKSWR